MWPLSIFLFLAAAAPAPQQKPLDVFQDFRNLKLPVTQQQKPLDVSHDFRQLKLPVMQTRQSDKLTARKLTDESQRNTCYTMRSYFFRRQDGQAPVPAGMITCTPASVLQQRKVSPVPELILVPLGAQPQAEK